MPMSPRLLRPKAARLLADADASAYIAAVEQADQQSLEQAVKTAIFEFVTGCKADGIWTPIKRCCILMGARTLSGALTPLVGAAPTNNGPFVSGDYNRTTGLGMINGVGIFNTTKYLATGYANAGEGQNDFHCAVYASDPNSGAATQSYIGAGAANNGDTILAGQGSANLFTRNRAATSASLAGGAVAGLIGMARGASASYTIRGNATNSTANVTSQTPSATNFDVFRRSNGDTYLTGKIAFYSIGANLTLSTLEARVTTLYNAIGAASL